MTWWQRLRRRGRLERELDAELRFHFDRLVDDNIRAGMPPGDARRAARLEFGGVEQVKEDCRDARTTRWAHDLAADVRFAARLLRKDRGFTALAVMALALGIGVNNGFFTIVNAMCLRGPLEDPAGLVHVSTVNAAGRPGAVSRAEVADIAASAPALARVGAYASAPVALSDDRVAPERATAAYVSPDAFALASAVPAFGRGFDAADHGKGAAPVALIAASLWKRRFASDPGVPGRVMRIDGLQTVIVGVMRESFRFPNDAEIWLPLASMPDAGDESRHVRRLDVFGRLADGATIAAAQAELGELAGRLEREHPRSNEGIRFTAVPFNERFVAPITHPAWLAFITAGAIVLLVACANVANLLLARALRRSGEMAMRASLGATRGRIVRQLLVECALLAAVGGAAGLLVSLVGLRLMSAAIPADALPTWMALTMDARVFGVLAAVCVGAVFVFGFIPALHTSAASVTHIVRDQSRVRTGTAARRWTTAFLALQFALAFILLSAVTTNILLRQAEVPTIDVTNVLTTWVTLPGRTYATEVQRAPLYEQLTREATNIPGVSSATLASGLPFDRAPQRTVVVPGRVSGRADAATTVGTVAVDAGYFETFGVGVLRGRDFAREADGAGSTSVIVNERFAELYFPDQDPLGQRFHLRGQNDADSGPALTIAGIAPTVRRGRAPGEPLVYRPIAGAWPATAVLILRHRPGDATAAATLRERVRIIDRDLPLFRTRSMEAVIRDAGWNGRVSSGLINTISAIALILAVVGLYGVTAHTVAVRAREMGVRVALGASARDVSWLVLRRALFQLGIGVPAGAALTILWNRAFIVQSPGSEVGTRILVLVLVALTVVVVGVLACLIPARRAARLDPLAAIRHE